MAKAGKLTGRILAQAIRNDKARCTAPDDNIIIRIVQFCGRVFNLRTSGQGRRCIDRLQEFIAQQYGNGKGCP